MAAKLYKNPNVNRIYETSDSIEQVLEPEYFNKLRAQLAEDETILMVRYRYEGVTRCEELGRYHLRISQMIPYVQAVPDSDSFLVERIERLERLLKVATVAA